ncbi:MAG: hypothetical protein COZ10_06445 [Comamonadaceae bacterium CG_4_10_14_3_um_filter_60_75]|nr:MAG: hypothetical protein COZ10_06445 [Comamonadaceae bacterium CG_4_10_14_3_um_filter_60_75]
MLSYCWSCPPEILIGLHLDAKRFADLIKLQSATTLFREGKLSSGMASRWCGARLLDNNDDDFARETVLL